MTTNTTVTPQVQAYAPVRRVICPRPQAQQVSCNAVKIDIHKPQVGIPQSGVYNYPEASLYTRPRYQVCPVYQQQVPVNNANFPQQPQVMVQPPKNNDIKKRPEVVNDVASTINKNVKVPEPNVTQKEFEKVENKPSIISDIDTIDNSDVKLPIVIPENITERLGSDDLKTQEEALMDIEKTYKNLVEFGEKKDAAKAKDPESPETKKLVADYDVAFDKVSDTLLDEKLINNLLTYIGRDYSNLQAPSPEKIELLAKQKTGQTLTKAENDVVNKLTPYEQAERNEQFALFAMNYVQTMYMESYKKKFNSDADLVNVPGIKQMVDVVKEHPTPELRTSAIISLQLLPKREQDKELLSELFSISAAQDADKGVRDAANKALADLQGGTTVGSTAKVES